MGEKPEELPGVLLVIAPDLFAARVAGVGIVPALADVVSGEGAVVRRVRFSFVG